MGKNYKKTIGFYGIMYMKMTAHSLIEPGRFLTGWNASAKNTIYQFPYGLTII